MDLNASPEEAKFFETRGAEVAESLQPVAQPDPDPAPAPEADPKPASTPAPEVAADPPAAKPDAPEADDPKQPRQVPLPVLMEERGKRKATEERLRAAEEELAKLRTNPQAPAKPELPEVELNPLAVIENLQKRLDDRDAQDREQTEAVQFQNHVIRMEEAYVKENPEYPQAVEYLKTFRTRQLQALGCNDQQIMMAMAAEAAQTARYALQNDLSPAQVFHDLAKVSGFKVEPPKDPDPPKPDPAAVAKLETLRAGAAASKSLSSGGGGAPEATLTLDAISKMDGADFDKMWKDKTVRRLMGG